MIENLLANNECKTLEYKENTKSLKSIVRTIVAMTNSSGGNIVIGVSDKDKKIVGVQNPLLEEEKLASAIADSIEPLLIPDIQILSFRNKEILVIQVQHLAGPYFLRSAGMENGTYIRLGSTNRIADNQTILALQMLSKNILFDELPCLGSTVEDLDEDVIEKWLSSSFTNFSKRNYESLGILTKRGNQLIPTNGAVLLFSRHRFNWFPDAIILCVRFAGDTHEHIIDQKEIKTTLIDAHEEVLKFIKNNTRTTGIINESVREDVPQYHPKAIREALINSIVHTDYSLQGANIQISIFDNRIQITNPGGLTYGQTMEMALSGVSRMRNRMMGRIFREVKLIERLGTGLKRIVNVYERLGGKMPEFKESHTYFQVTLYSTETKEVLEEWEKSLIKVLKVKKGLSTTEISKIWNVTTRTASTRLNKMVDAGRIIRVATSPKDPYTVYKLSGG